jgi:NAD+ diphosphatase
MALDRAATARADPAWVTERLGDPDSRGVFAGREGVLVRDGEEPELLRRPLGDLAAAGAPVGQPILLGLDGTSALFAIDLDALPRAAADTLTRGGRVIAVRAAGAVLPRREGGLAAYLTAILNWHRANRFCANCGTATEVREAGDSRHCPSCGAVHFPRTDPVVIMVVACGERLLMGRDANWPAHRYSVLAGYVAPGETLEEAVVREVREESGVEVSGARYLASQPWPFPSSLMLGFEARSPGGEPTAGDGELEDVRWFTLEEVRAAIRGQSTTLELPRPVSIARQLIEHFVASQPE